MSVGAVTTATELVNSVYTMFSPDNENGKRNVVRATWAVIGISIVYYWLSRVFGFSTESQFPVGDGEGIPFHFSYLTIGTMILFWLDGVHYIQKYEWRAKGWKVGLATFVVVALVMASVLMHEFMHAAVAAYFGHPITSAGFSWWGAYVAWAGNSDTMTPIQTIAICLAGPLTNLVIGFIAAVLVFFMDESLVENSIQYLAHVNISLGVFNLFPFFALDGGKAVDSFLRLFIASDGWRFGITLFLFVVSVRWYNRPGAKGRRLQDLLTKI